MKVSDNDRNVNELRNEKEQLVSELAEATSTVECLANQNQELEQEVSNILVINHILTPLSLR